MPIYSTDENALWLLWRALQGEDTVSSRTGHARSWALDLGHTPLMSRSAPAGDALLGLRQRTIGC